MTRNETEVRWPAMDKRSLSERDICTKFITPALHSSSMPVKACSALRRTTC